MPGPGSRRDRWDELVRLVRAYAAERYGFVATGITIHGGPGPGHLEPFPPVPVQRLLPLPEPPPEPPPGAEAGGEAGGQPWHSAGFLAVEHEGVRYTFTKQQARVIEVLWAAWEKGEPGVAEAELLKASGSSNGRERLYEVFRSRGTNPAWGVLVVRGEPTPAGEPTYRLAFAATRQGEGAA